MSNIYIYIYGERLELDKFRQTILIKTNELASPYLRKDALPLRTEDNNISLVKSSAVGGV